MESPKGSVSVTPKRDVAPKPLGGRLLTNQLPYVNHRSVGYFHHSHTEGLISIQHPVGSHLSSAPISTVAAHRVFSG